jgi:anti-anti-sigma factor
MSDGRLPWVRVGQWMLVVLPVDIDSVSSPALAQELNGLLTPDVNVLVLDMTATGFCDSSGVRTLVLAHRQAQAHASELRLVVPSSAVRRILGLTGADKVLRVFWSMGEALADAPDPVRARQVEGSSGQA